MTGSPSRGIALVVLVSLVVSVGSLRNGYTLDDHVIVETNPMVRDPGHLARILDSPYWSPLLGTGSEESQAFGLYRPLTIASLALDRWLLGPSPLGHHAVNVLLHGLCSLGALLLLGRLVPPGVALLGALLFAVHPVHAEVVAGVVGRSELLSTLFLLLALLARYRGRQVGGALGLLLSTLSLACGFLALLAKENAVVLPALLLVLEFAPVEDRGSDGIGRRLGFVVLAAGVVAGFWFGLRMPVLGEVVTTRPPLLDNPIAHLSFPASTLTALRCLARALRLLVLPLGLSADYSYRQIPPVTGLSPDVAMALVVLVVGGVLGIRVLLRRVDRPGICWGLVLFLVAWLPVSNLVVPIGTIFAERLLYLPSVFGCLLVSSLGHGVPLPGSSFTARAARVLPLALLGFLMAQRCQVFRGDASLLPELARRAPASARARYATGNHLLSSGATRAEGENHLLVALWILPEQVNPRLVVGRLRRGQGDLEEALRHYLALRALRPRSGVVRAELAQVLLERGQEVAAEREVRLALSREAGLVAARHLLGRILVGRASGASSSAEAAPVLAEAVTHLRQALDREPERWDIRFDRAVALERMQRFEEAAADYERVATIAKDRLPTSLARLAVCRLSLGASGEDLEAVVSPLLEALRIAPTSPEIRSVASSVLASLPARQAAPGTITRLRQGLDAATGSR